MDTLFDRTLQQVPFERFLRFLTLQKCSTKQKNKLILEISGFQGVDVLFHDKFQKKMMASSEVVANFLRKKPKRNSMAFKSCIVYSEVEELYNVMELSDVEFQDSWLGNVLNFIEGKPLGIVMANVLRANGKSVEEVHEILLKYVTEIDLEDLKKYFYHFFEVSWMRGYNWGYFKHHQAQEEYQNLYSLISKTVKDEHIMWAFGHKEVSSTIDGFMESVKYSMNAITEDMRLRGGIPSRMLLQSLKNSIPMPQSSLKELAYLPVESEEQNIPEMPQLELDGE